MKIRLQAAVAMRATRCTGSVWAASAVEEGKKIAFNRGKGSWVACDILAYNPLTMDVLIEMKSRFLDKAGLRK